MSTSTSFPQFQLRSSSTDVSRMLRAGARSMGLGFRRRLQVDAVLTDRQPTEVQHVAQQLFSSMHASLASRASDFLRSVACRVNMNLSANYPIISGMLADAGAVIARACELPQLPATFPGAAAPAMQASPGSADLSSPACAPLLQQFLDRADRLEVLYACLLSDLSNMAYEVSRLEDEQELMRHSLTLVSSSARPLYGPVRQEEGSGSAAAGAGAGSKTSGPQAGSSVQNGKKEARRSAGGSSSSHAGAGGKHAGSRHGANKGKAAASQQAARAVGGGTGVQAAATSPPRSSPVAASTHHSTKRAPLSSSTSSRTHAALGAASVNHALPPAAAAATCLDSVDSAGTRDAAMEAEAVSECPLGIDGAAHPAVETAGTSGAAPPKGAAAGSEAMLPAAPAPPADWFCADDTATQTRYIVIQGSTSLGHWAINFNIEPVPFEDAALGVRVHRGVYEAAIQLYEELLPLVRQHLASSPGARVALGGHSLGGSVAAVIMLLLVWRAGVAPERLAPSYAFGAPAVFCAAGAGGCLGQSSSSSMAPPMAAAPAPTIAPPALDQPCAACATPQAAPAAAAAAMSSSGSPNAPAPALGAAPAACSGRRSLMARLGIPESLLTNVVMHKDIVPRAFLCNYTIVADFLKRFMPSFKDHTTLSAGHEHKYLYTYIGTVAVLRPDDNAPFVLNDNAHPMLPDEAGLYKLRDPQHAHSPAAAAPAAAPTSSAEPSDAGSAQAHPQAAGTAAAAAHAGAAPVAPVPATATPAVLPSLRAALLAFMDHPHPLQYLSSLSSYGTEGAISRYHNPANYTRGLVRLLEPLTSQWTHLTH